MKAEAFLSRCDKVKTTGQGTWLACCPGHADKRPSMTVRELEDGTVLLHCFSGCDVGQILGAVGMDFADLFPDRPKGSPDHVGPLRRRAYPAADVLEALSFETLVVSLIAGDMYHKRDVSEEDYARLRIALERIQAARELANGPLPLKGRHGQL